MSKTDTKISRKTAGRLLKVSIRTVDRYIRLKKLSTSPVNGRIWLDKREVLALKRRKARVDNVDMEVDMSGHNLSIDKGVDNVDKNVDKVELVERENVHSVSTSKKRPQRIPMEIYRKLFTELREELRERQERLEIANYRVGQLEAQLRNSISLLEYHREGFERDKREEALKEKLSESDSLLKRVMYKLKYESFIKKLYFFIILLIIALQPLWLFFFRGD